MTEEKQWSSITIEFMGLHQEVRIYRRDLEKIKAIEDVIYALERMREIMRDAERLGLK